MRSPRRAGSLIAGLLMLLVLAGTGCAGTLKGQVVDAQTGNPIAGAVVLGVWMKYVGLPGLEHSQLVGVKETETDAEGRFVLETLRGEESITVYKFGYVAWNNLFIFPTSARRQNTSVPSKISLEKFPPGESHKRHMDFVAGATRGRENPDSTPQLWKAIRPEHFLK